jgi:hypothetical protein
VVLANDEQLLARGGVVAARDITEAAIADIKAIDDGEAQRARLWMTRPHMLTPAKVPNACRSSKVLLKKPCVLAISLPGKVEGIADEWNAPEQKIQADIRQHPTQEDG